MKVALVQRGLCTPKAMEHDPLARMAAALRDGLGWQVVDQPDESADVNYFLPYADYALYWPGWRKTKTAAMFFHREVFGGKTALWDDTAKAVDLRIVNSEKYKRILEPFGPTARVCHPIDRGHFACKGTQTKNIPLKVGINGRVNTNGRKGEWMLPMLMQELVASKVQFEALGRDWPVPSKWVGWSHVPQWYYSIDILLCTSILDAGPGGPYEALACGIPVVIPTDVGSLDELPDMPGIWRYVRGYPQHMAEVLRLALIFLKQANPQDLSRAVKWHSLQNWCDMHRQAMESLA